MTETTEKLFEKWRERFEYWKKFQMEKNKFLSIDADWWLSRFSDDHANFYGWIPDILWNCFIAPELGIKSVDIQLRLGL